MIGMGSLLGLPVRHPGHLDLLELPLAGRLRIVLEPIECAHPAMEVREADAERVHLRVGLVEPLRDVLGVFPRERHELLTGPRRAAGRARRSTTDPLSGARTVPSPG